MTSTGNIGASFAQHIRTNGPMWMLQGDDQANLTVVCNGACGGTVHTNMKLTPNTWYDFKVNFVYQT